MLRDPDANFVSMGKSRDLLRYVKYYNYPYEYFREYWNKLNEVVATKLKYYAYNTLNKKPKRSPL